MRKKICHANNYRKLEWYAMELDEIKQISSSEAYSEIRENSGCLLVDVRSELEWRNVGIPDLENVDNSVILVELQSMPAMVYNEKFLHQLEDALGETDVDKVMFICKSGVRSQNAAMYSKDMLIEKNKDVKVYNISDGFEGKGFSIFGGQSSGWKNSGLPWKNLD